MKLVQKLLSHGLLIGFFAATFFGYLYRAELFPQWLGEKQSPVAASTQTESAEQIALQDAQSGEVEPVQAETPASAPPVASPQADAGTADLPPVIGVEANTPAGTVADLPPLAEPEKDNAQVQQLAAADPDRERPPAHAAGFASEPGRSAVIAGDTEAPARYRPLETEAQATPPVTPQQQASSGQEGAQAEVAQTEVSAVTATPETTAAAEVAQAEVAQAEVAQAEVAQAEVAQAEVAQAEVAQAEVAQAEVAQAEVAQAEVAQAEVAQAEVAQAEVAQAEVAQAEVAQAEVAQAEVAQAEVAQAEVAQAEVAQAEVAQAEVAQAEVAQTEIAKLGAAGVETTPSEESSVFQQQLEVARGYFWRRDLRRAVEAYRNLAESWPEQADAWGELGNLYYTMGSRPAAADAYYRAIGLLLDQGEATRAQELLQILYRLDSRRANEIEQRLRQVSS